MVPCQGSTRVGVQHVAVAGGFMISAAGNRMRGRSQAGAAEGAGVFLGPGGLVAVILGLALGKDLFVPS